MDWKKEKKNMAEERGAHCARLLFVEATLGEERERLPFLVEDGKYGEEGGEAVAEEGVESEETERLLVGLLLGEPRGEE